MDCENCRHLMSSVSMIPAPGQFRQLVDARNERVNGIPLRYINDLVVARDSIIYFTSSSTKWRPSQLLNIMFEGETSGRWGFNGDGGGGSGGGMIVVVAMIVEAVKVIMVIM